MSDKEKNVITGLADATNLFKEAFSENTVLAMTASYLAGKEAGLREAAKENQPG